MVSLRRCKNERGKGWLLGSIYCSVLLPVRRAFAMEPRLALNSRSFRTTGLGLQMGRDHCIWLISGQECSPHRET